MSRNTGKPSEDIFESYWDNYGKGAFLYRFRDKSDLVGMNQGAKEALKLLTGKLPSDYMLTVQGRSGFAEVKSTKDPKAFKKSCVKPHQIGFARRQLAAGGNYWFFIHRLTTNTWYWVPAQFLLEKFETASSIPWWDFDGYEWSAINA